ncbi:hypothetical protein [Allosediminivita pacifica]|uniref:Uncharacterized protein n=1 Tax=Allosediminivita pacifica TaxID=1267769 RepID=A0A2T6AC68_9RHOB|nr:hypothetical protein [Allosediminivita pacifica]PTX41394.1 hypothetical protein C8N44_12962 [Allosediminivita pacifica]GGB23370.1 hypothetical protein GCM10011324_36730 [Allosediminivita pacifica]
MMIKIAAPTSAAPSLPAAMPGFRSRIAAAWPSWRAGCREEREYAALPAMSDFLLDDRGRDAALPLEALASRRRDRGA